MIEVDIHRSTDRAMQEYFDRYKQRYGVDPIIANQGVASTILKDLVREVGLDRTCRLVIKYLAMDGDNDWFKKKGHTLEEFKRNISAVNSALGPDLRKETVREKQIEVQLACDLCGKCFKWLGTPSFLQAADTERCCSACIAIEPNLSVAEAMLETLPIRDEMLGILRNPNSQEASKQFGKLSLHMIQLKQAGKLPNLNWKEYSDAIGFIARFLTKKRLRT